MKENHAIIIWHQNKDINNFIEERFDNNIVRTLIIPPENREIILNKLNLAINKEIINDHLPFLLYVIEIDEEYEEYNFNNIIKKANPNIIMFKLDLAEFIGAENFNNYVYCTDNREEMKNIVNIFNIK